MNYLTVDVYRSAGIDCTNNGVTSETSPTFVVPCEHGPISGDWAEEHGVCDPSSRNSRQQDAHETTRC